MKKSLVFLLLLFSILAFSQTIRKVTSLNGLPATGTITYNDSSDTNNNLSPWTLKIDIKTLDGSIKVKTEYTFGTEEVVTDKMLSSFFYQYNDEGNVVKKLTIKSVADTEDLKLDNSKWDSATFVDYDKNKVCYNIKF